MLIIRMPTNTGLDVQVEPAPSRETSNAGIRQYIFESGVDSDEIVVSFSPLDESITLLGIAISQISSLNIDVISLIRNNVVVFTNFSSYLIEDVTLEITLSPMVISSLFNMEFNGCLEPTCISMQRTDNNTIFPFISCELGASTSSKVPGSFTFGDRVYASYGAFAIGNCTIAYGQYSCAEGNSTKAYGFASHAEGRDCLANGDFSHAEGFYARSQGQNSHAEGGNTWASGYTSRAEGNSSHAGGDCSHAEGYYTITDNFASHVLGKLNKSTTTGGTINNTIGDAFVLGNGTDNGDARSNAFRITYAGQTYMTGVANTSGADYAEFFEWQDGNPDAEDRVGRFVTMEGEFIRYASQGDYILGIVSGNPAVVGNSDEDYKHRWLKDDFGRLVREYLEPSEELIDTTDMSEDDLNQLRHDPDIEEREGAFYRKTEVPTDHITASWRFKQSPDYDPDQPYIERKDRSEWDYVGMLGVLAVYDDGTCEVNSYCQCGENGIATKSSMAIAGQSFRVIKRIGPNLVKVVFR